MRVFLTGANGRIGSMIVRELIEAGHSVVGLVRDVQKGEQLAEAHATPITGSIQDLNVLRRATENADGVILTAFGLDLSKVERLAFQDIAAIRAFGEVFAGSKRPLVATSGFLPSTGG